LSLYAAWRKRQDENLQELVKLARDLKAELKQFKENQAKQNKEMWQRISGAFVAVVLVITFLARC
tara:strand:+ start:413 stop:607 length:195 start_codon:yes stop_codon:yes gene_type:complete